MARSIGALQPNGSDIGALQTDPAAPPTGFKPYFVTDNEVLIGMKKNVASQSISAQMITISDGSDFTGTVTVTVTKDGGTQTAGGGSVVHEGGGEHSYAPTQAETNADFITFKFSGTGAVTNGKEVYTGFPQTVDNAIGIADIKLDTGTNLPAQIGNLTTGVSGGGAVNASGATITTGTQTLTFEATKEEDGVLHEVAAAAGNTDFEYTVTLGANQSSTAVTWRGYIQSNGDEVELQFYHWIDAAFKTELTLSGSNGTTLFDETIRGIQAYTGTGVNLGKVRFRFLSTTATNIATDRIRFEFSTNFQSVGYALGRIWTNTVSGEAGSIPFFNGVGDKASLLWSDTLLLATALDMSDFHIINGSLIQLSANSDNYSLFGNNWTLDVNTRSVDGAYIEGATVSGICTSPNGVRFNDCDILNLSVQKGHFNFSDFNGTVTHTLAGNYNYHNCNSNVPAVGGPIFTKTLGQLITAQWRTWAGSLTVSNIEANDEYTISGEELGDIVLNGVDGTVKILGQYESLIDNRTGGSIGLILGAYEGSDVTDIKTTIGIAGIGLTAVSLSTAGILAIWKQLTSALTTVGTVGKLIVDNINATISSRSTAVQNRQEMDTNSVDLNALISGQSTINGNVLLIPTTPMRGTDGANTTTPDNAGIAANGVAIAALKNFDPANDTVAIVNLVNTLTTYTNNTPQTGDAFLRLATYRLGELMSEALASQPFATSLLGDLTQDNPDATGTQQFSVAALMRTWDEVISKANHNIPQSSGKELRNIASVVIRTDTAQGPGTGNNQIQFDTGASATDGAYDPALVTIIGGTGIGQTRLILQYDGTTKTATVDRNWKVNPDATSEFNISADAGREHVNEGLAQSATINTIKLNALASSINNAYIDQTVFIRSGTGDDQTGLVIAYDGLTKIATIATNWGVIPDSTSAYVMLPESHHTLESIAVAVWAALTSANKDPGSFGRAIGQIKEGVIATDGAINDASATTTSFITNLLGPQVYDDVSIVMINGSIAGESKPILSHNTTTGRITLSADDAYSSPPDDGATFNILTNHVHPTSQIATAVLTQIMAESYAADGVEPTLTQAIYLIQQVLTEFGFVGTSNTVKKLDGSTTAAIMTLDNGTNPTSSTRTT